MSKATTHRVRAALGIDKRKISALLALAHAVYEGMLANPGLFPSPNPALPALLALIAALEAAEVTTRTRVRGAAAVRDARRDELCTALENERMYVQSLCDASPEQALTLIKGAGMDAAKLGAQAKPVLHAKQGTQSGCVILVANETLLVGRGVHKKRLFNWQMSADGGKTWTLLPPTPLASTEVTGLTPGTTYAFRVSATVARMTGDWSQPVSIMVR
jgi:hypothetical protein